MLLRFGKAQDGGTLFHTEQNLGDEGYNLIFVSPGVKEVGIFF